MAKYACKFPQKIVKYGGKKYNLYYCSRSKKNCINLKYKKYDEKLIVLKKYIFSIIVKLNTK